MVYKRNNNILCFDNSKQAALYFERVLPLDELWRIEESKLFKDIIYDLQNIHSDEVYKILKHNLNVFFRKLTERATSGEAINKIQWFFQIHNDLNKLGKSKEDIRNEENLKTIIEYTMIFCSIAYINNIEIPTLGKFQDYVNEFLKAMHMKHSDIIISSDIMKIYEAENNDINISIANIPIVNTENVDWENILEFRKDNDSKRKLRNLRLFIYEKYEGKSRAYIEDDIERRVDEYHDTCKKHGFDNKISKLSLLLDSKNLSVIFLSATGAAIWGEPIVAAGTVMTGAVIEIGKMCIELSKKKYAFHMLKNNHEMAYIIEARERLKKMIQKSKKMNKVNKYV